MGKDLMLQGEVFTWKAAAKLQVKKKRRTEIDTLSIVKLLHLGEIYAISCSLIIPCILTE